MIIIAIILLIIGITKLYLVVILNTTEIKELFYNTPILFDEPFNIMKAILTGDGLACTLGGIALLCL